MVMVESLKDYLDKDEFKKLVTTIFNTTKFIGDDYPNYKNWFYNKQIPGIALGERDILFIRNPEKLKEIIGIVALKNTLEEQKICTLYVKGKYRKMGIGTILIEEAMKYLNTPTPIIEIPAYKLVMFKSFIKRYNWKLSYISHNSYGNELCFNNPKTKKLNLTRK